MTSSKGEYVPLLYQSLVGHPQTPSRDEISLIFPNQKHICIIKYALGSHTTRRMSFYYIDLTSVIKKQS